MAALSTSNLNNLRSRSYGDDNNEVEGHDSSNQSHGYQKHGSHSNQPLLTTAVINDGPRHDETGENSDSEEGDEYKPGRISRPRRVGTLSKDFTDEEEAAVVRKLDRRLVLLLAFLYLLSFLDRSNIGNARIAGLETSLKLSSSQYDWLLTAFYLTYISFEWMIMLYRVVPAHIYISLCVLGWGIVASLQSCVTSFKQLLVLRSLLGITEAAFGPGVPFYMTFFYRRSELAYRVGLQISAAPLATSFASSLAWVIVKFSQNGPIESWRALFLVEGFPSILAAGIAYYFIPDTPAHARYLTPRERKVATIRLNFDDQAITSSDTRPDSSSPHTSAHRMSHLKEILNTVLDPKSYMTALMFLSVNVSFSSLPVFLPTIINSMSFSPLTSQALAAPPYLCAFVMVLIIGHKCDKTLHSRAYYLCGVASLSAASYAAIAIAGYLHESIGEEGSITIRYVAVYGAAMGLFSAVVLIITWTLNNQASATGRGTGLTILNIVGQCGPLIGVRIFPKDDGPYYVRGMVVCASFMAGVAVLALILRLYLKRLNRKLDAHDKTRGFELVSLRDSGYSSPHGEGDNEDDDHDDNGPHGTANRPRDSLEERRRTSHDEEGMEADTLIGHRRKVSAGVGDNEVFGQKSTFRFML